MAQILHILQLNKSFILPKWPKPNTKKKRKEKSNNLKQKTIIKNKENKNCILISLHSYQNEKRNEALPQVTWLLK